MKRSILLLFVLIAAQIAQAIPCGTLLDNLDVRTYNFLHSPPSTRKPLLVAAFERTELPTTQKAMLGAGATVRNSFSVTDIQFTSDATVTQMSQLQRFTYAATVSLSGASDQCFFVWFSDKSMDINVIIDQDQYGNLVLGSNNKLDTNVYMTLAP